MTQKVTNGLGMDLFGVSPPPPSLSSCLILVFSLYDLSFFIQHVKNFEC